MHNLFSENLAHRIAINKETFFCFISMVANKQIGTEAFKYIFTDSCQYAEQ